MAGSALGTILRVTTWGESHGKGIGVVVDGCPAGLPLEEGDIQSYLNRRKPGQSKFTTARQEGDQVEILSGVFGGRTTGTPIALEVRNTDQRSHDYSNIMDIYRPGHADYTFDQKYGFRDYRGGGRSSGRETIARVAAGAIACRLLESLGITVRRIQERWAAFVLHRSALTWTRCGITGCNSAGCPGSSTGRGPAGGTDGREGLLRRSGGVYHRGMPAGAGEPVFEKLDANLPRPCCPLARSRDLR